MASGQLSRFVSQGKLPLAFVVQDAHIGYHPKWETTKKVVEEITIVASMPHHRIPLCISTFLNLLGISAPCEAVSSHYFVRTQLACLRFA
jgi:hypothetical protein